MTNETMYMERAVNNKDFKREKNSYMDSRETENKQKGLRNEYIFMKLLSPPLLLPSTHKKIVSK